MTNLKTTALRVAGGLLASAVLFACDGVSPVTVPDSSDGSRLGIEQVSQADKERAASGRQPSSFVGPMQSNYYAVEQITFESGPTDLSNLGPVCDDCVMNDVPIGFDFEFYGETYSSLQISSNGFIRFNPPNNDSGCCSGRVIPLNDTWNNIIAFAWTDLIPQGADGGRLRYETRGTAPNRMFILHADSVRYFGGTQPNLIQWVILHEGSNEIEIHTQLMTSRVITQGIENAAGTDAAYVEGRVATTFSLNNDGVRFTPLQITDVEIDNVYSGLPAQDPGVIDLNDEYVFIEIYDIEQYLPRPASADDVRIGSSWAEGVPAEGFEVLDINQDGNRDIRVWWTVESLVDAGELTPNTTQLTVWGNDPTSDEYFRGTVEVEVIGGPPPPEVCFDNGSMVTHPGAGPGGTHVSMSDPIFNTAGSNVRHFPPDPFFRVADDFTIDGSCDAVAIVTYAYETGAPTPTWTGFNLNIREAAPPGGSVVGTVTSASIEFSGIYRVFNGELSNTQRPVYRIIWDISSLNLAPGSYWIDWQVQGGASGWAPFVTLPPSTPGGNDTETVFDNGMQLTPDGWVPLLEAPGAETPFEVLGAGAAARLPSFGQPVATPHSIRRGPSSLERHERAPMR